MRQGGRHREGVLVRRDELLRARGGAGQVRPRRLAQPKLPTGCTWRRRLSAVRCRLSQARLIAQQGRAAASASSRRCGRRWHWRRREEARPLHRGVRRLPSGARVGFSRAIPPPPPPRPWAGRPPQRRRSATRSICRTVSSPPRGSRSAKGRTRPWWSSAGGTCSSCPRMAGTTRPTTWSGGPSSCRLALPTDDFAAMSGTRPRRVPDTSRRPPSRRLRADGDADGGPALLHRVALESAVYHRRPVQGRVAGGGDPALVRRPGALPRRRWKSVPGVRFPPDLGPDRWGQRVARRRARPGAGVEGGLAPQRGGVRRRRAERVGGERQRQRRLQTCSVC